MLRFLIGFLKTFFYNFNTPYNLFNLRIYVVNTFSE